MNSTFENPYASPESTPESRHSPKTAGTFAGVLGRSTIFQHSFYKFYISQGELLAAPLQWPVSGWHWVMQLLPLALFGGVVVVSWLWSPAAPYLVSVFLGMLVIWLIFMTVLLRSAGRKTRDIAALFDAVPRDLVSFLAIDGRSFLVSAAEVRSVDIAPRSQWKNTGRVAGTLRFVFLSASTTWTPMRVVVVGPYNIVAIRKELVTAGFPVRN